VDGAGDPTLGAGATSLTAGVLRDSISAQKPDFGWADVLSPLEGEVPVVSGMAQVKSGEIDGNGRRRSMRVVQSPSQILGLEQKQRWFLFGVLRAWKGGWSDNAMPLVQLEEVLLPMTA